MARTSVAIAESTAVTDAPTRSLAHTVLWGIARVFSILVLALHTLYLVMLLGALGTVEQRMLVALTAYATYLVNAGQFLLKLRATRLQARHSMALG